MRVRSTFLYMSMDLLEFRKSVGVSQDQIAREVGFTQATISRLEHGKIRSPSYALVSAIQAWADRVARQQKLPVRKRLKLDLRHIVKGSRRN